MEKIDDIVFGLHNRPDPTADQLEPYTKQGASRELAIKMYYWQGHMMQMQMHVRIYCIYRSNDEQNKLYQQGRTAPGNIVTQAPAGKSAHNRTSGNIPASDAFDACPVIAGKPSWSLSGDARLIWEEMGRAAGLLGLKWGRHYRNLGGDWSHFQFHRHELDK